MKIDKSYKELEKLKKLGDYRDLNKYKTCIKSNFQMLRRDIKKEIRIEDKKAKKRSQKR
jgi:hypothetical protein